MKLTASFSPFTSFCEGPEDIESGFGLFLLFHKRNYGARIPEDRNAETLVVSSGVGYFQHFLKESGFRNVLGIDSDPEKVDYARKRGFRSECACAFEFLETRPEAFDFIFAEQEVNHLTRSEFKRFLELCYAALRPGGRVILAAANCANPLIATEYPGNNMDHYISLAENGIRQYFSLQPFREVHVFPHDFYVLKNNPLNYAAKFATGLFHLFLKIAFKMYGKSNRIFTKRLGVLAIK